MKQYIVKQGETISDVVLNSTGSLSNWDAILTANSITDWSPELKPGQTILIPDSVNYDLNSFRQLQFYPACNSVVNDIYTLIGVIRGLFKNNWILASHFWNDNALWIDGKTWND